MNTQIFKPLFLALSASLLVLAIYVTWQWSAPWGINAALDPVRLEMGRVCRGTKDCRRIDMKWSWNMGTRGYQTSVLIGVANTMPSEERRKLADITREAILASTVWSPYRFNLRVITVNFVHV